MKIMYIIVFAIISHEIFTDTIIASAKPASPKSQYSQIKDQLEIPSNYEIKSINKISQLESLVAKLTDDYDRVDTLLKSNSKRIFGQGERQEAALSQQYRLGAGMMVYRQIEALKKVDDAV